MRLGGYTIASSMNEFRTGRGRLVSLDLGSVECAGFWGGCPSDSYVLVRWQWQVRTLRVLYEPYTGSYTGLRSSELGASNALLRERDDVITK
jgi:hypothetical protein